MTKKSISIAKFADLLEQLESDVCVSEAHGAMVGMLCVGPEHTRTDEAWEDMLIELLDIAEPTPEDWSYLNKVRDIIKRQLTSTNCDFNILVPSDDEPIEERLAALANWSSGFLAGIGMMGITSDDINEVVDELLDDIAQISNVDSDNAANEADEINYTELVEFVRIAVQNIHLEMHLSDTTMLH